MDGVDPQEQCDLLKKLSPELRNRIYSLALARDATPTVALGDACPPSKNLILSCKAVYNEAHKMHLAEYRAYWTQTHFIITLNGSSPRSKYEATKYEAIDALKHHDIDNIDTITVDSSRLGHLCLIERRHGSRRRRPCVFHCNVTEYSKAYTMRYQLAEAAYAAGYVPGLLFHNGDKTRLPKSQLLQVIKQDSTQRYPIFW